VAGKHLQFVNRHAVVRQTRQRFVPQVVPVQVDLRQRFSIRWALNSTMLTIRWARA